MVNLIRIRVRSNAFIQRGQMGGQVLHLFLKLALLENFKLPKFTINLIHNVSTMATFPMDSTQIFEMGKVVSLIGCQHKNFRLWCKTIVNRFGYSFSKKNLKIIFWAYLMFFRQSELPDIPTSGILAPVKEHGPRTSKSICGPTSIRIHTLTSTRTLLVGITPSRRGNTKTIQFVD